MNSSVIFVSLFSILLLSCSNEEVIQKETNNILPEIVEFSEDDTKLKFITSSKINRNFYSDTILLNGIVLAPPQSIFSVYSLTRGYIDDVRVYQGSRVKKGDILCRIKHPEILTIQQKFLSDYIQLRTDSLEYERQKLLLRDSATSIRTLEMAKNAYFQSLAVFKSQEKLITSLGFNAKNILNGSLYSDVVLLSPSNGVVSSVLINQGSYIESNTLLFTIQNSEHLHIEVFVSPSTYSSLKNIHTIYFKTISDNTLREAEVINISSFVENETKSIVIHCHPKEKSQNLIVGESVSAFAFSDSLSGYLIPRNSLFIFDDKEYIFIQTSNSTFKLIPVQVIKRNSSNFIIDSDQISGYPIVTIGAEILKEAILAEE
ncbi:cation efflux system protein [Thermaurantimonas aggregans]|uniref:Cation efflux system protein n=1 Tax=Thermaurantimonas aggregans TaxID=2173829 RepID=A0A401XMU3_9FLAO|nr:efflux RND transporter periplasmic adaptor subunit [Thermaurantimonas aggregans]MCX8149399.1 efflux RND transporter periplasmic adaptor subunit [Thermaurantimonas aggregans]GCD78306.1 cation efflux system protein [Thermaurantimonas aggregans]